MGLCLNINTKLKINTEGLQYYDVDVSSIIIAP